MQYQDQQSLQYINGGQPAYPVPPAYNQPGQQQPYGVYQGQPYNQGFNQIQANRQRQAQIIAQ